MGRQGYRQQHGNRCRRTLMDESGFAPEHDVDEEPIVPSEEVCLVRLQVILAALADAGIEKAGPTASRPSINA